MKTKIIRLVIGTALILLVPLIAMMFSDDANWNWFDFVVMATLLIGSGITFELVTTKVNPKYRAAIAIIFAAAVLLIWVELAVGLFGSPIAGS